LVVKELLTAHPVAIFSPDWKGRIPLQGGLKKETTSKNHHKAASLKVLYLVPANLIYPTNCNTRFTGKKAHAARYNNNNKPPNNNKPLLPIFHNMKVLLLLQVARRKM
jgi:hypothetical protein